MFDTAGLTEVKMRKYRGRQGSYFVNDAGVCIAKTCSKCDTVLSADAFCSVKGRRFDLQDRCKKCRLPESRDRNSDPTFGYRSRYARNRARSDEEVFEATSRMRPDGTKKCQSCTKRLPVSRFYRNRCNDDGLSGYCKECDSSKRKRRKSRAVESLWSELAIPLECYICSGPYEEVEHVWCESSGGPDVPQNTLPVCIECNRGQGGKHTQMLLTYLWERFGAKEASVILRRVTMDYGVWPFDQPYVAEDWQVTA